MDSTMVHCESLELPGGRLVVYSTRAPYRTNDSGNEDAAAVVSINEHVTLLMVADGVGGTPGGGQAAVMTLQSVLAAVSQRESEEMRDTILSGIEQANQELIARGTGSATTLALVEISGRTVRPYHVGDSVALMVGQRGKVKLETLSHSPVSYAVESGVMTEAEGFHHEDRHLVSNIVGIPGMHVTLGMPLQMSAYDTVMLATDGVFDNLQRQEIVEIIRAGNLEQSGNELASRTWRKMTDESGEGKPDDLTFMLFRRNRLQKST